LNKINQSRSKLSADINLSFWDQISFIGLAPPKYHSFSINFYKPAFTQVLSLFFIFKIGDFKIPLYPHLQKKFVNIISFDIFFICTYIGQAKFPYVGSILGSSQFSVLPQLPPKTMLGLKEVKNRLENKQLALVI